MTPQQVRAVAAARKTAAERRARESRNANGTYGAPPEDMFVNPETGQMTSRELLRGNVEPDQERAAAGGAMQGLGLQFGDEAVGLLARLLEGPNYGTLRREQARATLEADAEAFPKTAVGSEVAGAIGTGLATAPLAASSSLVSLMGRGAALGATEGALHGAGRGEGGSERLEAGFEGARTGAVIGGMASPVLSGAGWAARHVTDPIGGAVHSVINKPRTRAANWALTTVLRRSGRSIDDVTDDVARAGTEGQPEYVIADALGSPGQRMLSGVARQPGDYAGEIEQFLNSRQMGQGDRLAEFVDDALNAPQNPQNLPVPAEARTIGNTGQTAHQVTERMTARRGAQADVAYDAARQGAGPVDVRGALAAIDDRIGGMQGSGVAGDSIDARLYRYRSRLAGTGDDGLSRELSDFDRVLGVKQAIQDDIGAAVRAGRGNEARELTRVMRELDSALEASSPAYRAANDQFARSSRAIGAVDQGAQATRAQTRAADNVQRYQSLPPEGQEAFRAGYADPTIGKMEAAAPGVNKARILEAPKRQTELGAMARDPALLDRQVGRENVMFETRNKALGGSRTADNLADMDDMKGFDSNLLVNLLAGRWGQAASQGTAMVGRAASGQNEATRELIARALLSRDPQATLGPALQQALTSDQRQRVLEAIVRSGGIRLGHVGP